MVLTTLNYLCTGYLNIFFILLNLYNKQTNTVSSVYTIIYQAYYVNINNFLPKFFSNPIITAELVNIGSRQCADGTIYITLDKCLCTVPHLHMMVILQLEHHFGTKA